MLGWGLNIVVGLAGCSTSAYVAFYAVGALLLRRCSRQNFRARASGPACRSPASSPLSGDTARLPGAAARGDYLAIVTLAFGEIIRVVILNWYDFTSGPNGISGIPKPTFFGLEFSRGEDGVAAFFGLEYSNLHRFVWLYYIILGLALLTNFVTLRLRRLRSAAPGRRCAKTRSPAGRSASTPPTPSSPHSRSAPCSAASPGPFFATRQGFISPESFTFIESAIILAIVVLGGLGSQIGVVFAAIVMIGGTEALRNLQDVALLQTIFGANFDPVQYRMLIFGLVMVVIMVWKPRGLVSSRSPSAVLKEKKRIGADLVAQGEGH
jgi:branched-chain amino acid transport system permease protein